MNAFIIAATTGTVIGLLLVILFHTIAELFWRRDQ